MTKRREEDLVEHARQDRMRKNTCAGKLLFVHDIQDASVQNANFLFLVGLHHEPSAFFFSKKKKVLQLLVSDVVGDLLRLTGAASLAFYLYTFGKLSNTTV